MAIQVMIFTQFTCGRYGKLDLHADFVCLFFRNEIRTYGNINIKKCLIRFCDTDKSRTDKVCRLNNSHTWKRSLIHKTYLCIVWKYILCKINLALVFVWVRSIISGFYCHFIASRYKCRSPKKDFHVKNQE